MVGSMGAPQLRSIVTKPVQLRLTIGRGRATSGFGVLRLCRPCRDGDNSYLEIFLTHQSSSSAQTGSFYALRVKIGSTARAVP